MMKARRLLLPLALCLAACSLGAAALAEQAATPEAGRVEHPLARLQFKNCGIVRSDMRFEYKTQPCYYVESPTAWTVRWGGHAGGSSYPYLWLIDRSGTATQQPKPNMLLVPPPLGMRSAAPLGGLGAGKDTSGAPLDLPGDELAGG